MCNGWHVPLPQNALDVLHVGMVTGIEIFVRRKDRNCRCNRHRLSIRLYPNAPKGSAVSRSPSTSSMSGWYRELSYSSAETIGIVGATAIDSVYAFTRMPQSGQRSAVSIQPRLRRSPLTAEADR